MRLYYLFNLFNLFEQLICYINLFPSYTELFSAEVTESGKIGARSPK